MRTLKTSEAAAFLNVSPNTLRSWERRFGFPRPRRSPGQHRLYTYGDITALRDALLAGLSISSAISVAREGLRSGVNPLLGSLAAFDAGAADEVMESTLALRSVEHSIDDVLLPALEQVAERHGPDSAPMAFAARWAGDWLRRAARLAYAPAHRTAIVIGDASRDEFDSDAVWIRALELVCIRSGPTPLCLPVRSTGSIAHALNAHDPVAIVIAGRHAPDDEVARWAYSIRSVAGPLPIALYRRKPGSERLRTSSARILVDAPTAAQLEVSEMLSERREAEEAASAPAAAEARHTVSMKRAVG
jgi:MerR family transcriptional regulator, light-induced transcriptional regulator